MTRVCHGLPGHAWGVLGCLGIPGLALLPLDMDIGNILRVS